MATENIVYLTLSEAVKFHVLYMRRVGETRFGVFDKPLVESALTRPRHAAIRRQRRFDSPSRDLAFRLDKKSSVARRQQTHGDFFDESVFEKERL